MRHEVILCLHIYNADMWNGCWLCKGPSAPLFLELLHYQLKGDSVSSSLSSRWNSGRVSHHWLAVRLLSGNAEGISLLLVIPNLQWKKTPYGVAFLSQKYIILNVGRYWIEIFLIKALLLRVRMGFLIVSVVPISLQFSFRGYIVRVDFYDAISKREI